MTLLMTVIMVLAFSIVVNADNGQLAADYSGKTVILSTNDVHGALDGYQYMAGLKSELVKRGANVILADAGDFSQGTTYVSEYKGNSAVQLMNLVGYDLSTIGNHEFDFGVDTLLNNVKTAEFDVLCSDFVKRSDLTPVLGESTKVIEVNGVKIGFFGVGTPESQTKSMPTYFVDYTFLTDETTPDVYSGAQADVDALKAAGADVIVGVTHLGVDAEATPYRSVDLYSKVNGIDMILDGHSHTVMTEGPAAQPIMSTGTKFYYIGVTVIDNTSKKIENNFLYGLRDADGNYLTDLTSDATVKAAADKIIDEVDAAYGAKIAESKVDLNGVKGSPTEPGNRVCETNSGDLIADAIMWYVMKDGADLGVPDENVIALTNGGGIRAPITVGDVTKQDILTVLPFGNTIAAVTVTGAELLESLEASTYCTPTPVGGFPQIAGMDITIEADKPFDPNDETYPGSTYYGPKTINRVTIRDINGKAFDPEAKYVVLTNNFCAVGGDTYYAFANASSQFDTGITLDYAVAAFIVEKLGGVIGEEYKDGQGRIIIEPEHSWDAGKVTTKATTTKAGVRTFTCEGCGATRTEAIAKNNMTVKTSTKTVSAKKVKKAKQTVKPITVRNAKGKVTYSKKSGSSKLTVNKSTGKVTVKKGTKKGTYKITVTVKSAATAKYAAVTKNVKVTVKVK
jgi:2',3'-cyclic-nucleotide 2'-phosphodiesterase (5'-nucleotidase family)